MRRFSFGLQLTIGSWFRTVFGLSVQIQAEKEGTDPPPGLQILPAQGSHLVGTSSALLGFRPGRDG